MIFFVAGLATLLIYHKLGYYQLWNRLYWKLAVISLLTMIYRQWYMPGILTKISHGYSRRGEDTVSA